MLKRKKMSTPAPYTEEQIRRWLGWLARAMQKRGQAVFQLEELHFSWLNELKLSKRDKFIIGFLLWLALMSFINLFNKQPFIQLLFWGVFLFGASLVDFRRKEKMGEELSWSISLLGKRFLPGVPTAISSLTGILRVCVVFFAFFWIFSELNKTIGIIAFVFGFSLGLFLLGIKRDVVQMKRSANEGIKLAGRNALTWGAGLGIIIGLPIGLIAGLKAGVTGGFAGALIMAFWAGGLDVLRHYLLRLILYLRGYAPLNYVRFLNYCAEELQFLQKAGGGYLFIHRYLQEHFAEMEQTKELE